MFNFAEGTSRFRNKDRKNFFVIARGSAFECVDILDYLNETEEITLQDFLEIIDLSRIFGPFSSITYLRKKIDF